MTGSDLTKCLLDLVGDATLEKPNEDFADAAWALLGLALSKLPPSQRETLLQAIEDGKLRRHVERFLGASGVPEVPCGTRH